MNIGGQIMDKKNGNRILFINGSIYLPGEQALKRTFYLFDMMLKKKMDVHFLTSNFNHYNKKKRNISDFFEAYPEYKNNVSFLDVPEYERNISYSRFKSNWIFEKQAKQWLKAHIVDYDIIYISLPTLYLVSSIRKICSENNVKIAIDVNDLWPEAFRVVLKNNFIYKTITFPMKYFADKGYSCADIIVAVSDEYKNRALLCNSQCKYTRTVYLGAMIERFDSGVEKYSGFIEKKEDEFWLAYAGTIGASYDLFTVIKGMKVLYDRGMQNIRFKIFGQGPDEQFLKEYVEKQEIKNVDFMGFLEYEKMAAYLSKCDVMLNCIKKRASQSIINKISDYYAAGKPILNSCVCDEMQRMVVDNKVGINYEAESVDEIVNAILKVYNAPEESSRMGSNARSLAEKDFDRQKTHLALAEWLEEI